MTYRILGTLAVLLVVASAWIWLMSGRPHTSPRSQDTHLSSAHQTASGDVTERSSSTPLAVEHAPALGASADRFRQLLKTQQFTAAVDLYAAIYDQHQESVSRHFRQLLLETAAGLKAEEPSTAGELLEAYVTLFYQDADALIMLAAVREQQMHYKRSLTRLQEAYLAAHTTTDLERIQSMIDNVISQYSRRLRQANDHAGLVSLYQSLTQRQPEHAPYYLALAQAHQALDNVEGALTALRYIQYDSTIGQQARNMLARLEGTREPIPNQQPLSVVPLVAADKHFLVDVLLNGVSTRLMLDTGASITVLTPATARAVDAIVDDGNLVTLHTANGPVRAPLAHLDTFQVGGTAATQFSVVVLDLSELKGAAGLLGMDFLSRYRFTIDHGRRMLLLNR